ncbi:hypothetical protein WUBG_18612 [Wuchereria bancrofti]|uniref:Uncharacterized protein n=1 Tax=Wuchereria bancrofti TaxID=6293 RepID=J9DLX3_WUCBA|nr:hypothetical protein WUBG_18612 [Wuchereria bancrofti]
MFERSFEEIPSGQNIPVEAVNWLVEAYCNVVKENGTETYHINEKAICRAKISQLLRAAVKFEYDTFEKALQQLLPIGVEFKEESWKGLHLLTMNWQPGRQSVT